MTFAIRLHEFSLLQSVMYETEMIAIVPVDVISQRVESDVISLLGILISPISFPETKLKSLYVIPFENSCM
jgi:hypothetical protein